MEISIGILCGGKSKRFGSRKIFHKIYGKTILEIVYNKFEKYSDDIFLQTSDANDSRSCNDFINISTKIYNDIIIGIGPLGGIYSILERAKHNKVFIVAGDLPFIDDLILFELIRYDSYHIIIPSWEKGFIEPLCAIYSKEILPVIKQQLRKNDFKISNLFETIKGNENNKFRIKYLNIDRLIQNNKIDPNCFKNVNTKDDLLV
jgi:molybdopterin-guanine dinucleotide biosynthesis protein A